MAENMWGKQPPKKQSFITPDMLKQNFWGPAEVPDQVRGQPRVTEWVSESGEWWTNDGQDDDGPGDATVPEGQDSVEAGEHDSWVAPVIEDSNPSEAGSSGNSNDYEFTPGEPVDITTEHDSWVAPVIKQFFPSSSEGDEDGPEFDFTPPNIEDIVGEESSWLAPILDSSNPSAPGGGGDSSDATAPDGQDSLNASGAGSSDPVTGSSNPSAPGSGGESSDSTAPDGQDSLNASGAGSSDPVTGSSNPSAPGSGGESSDATAPDEQDSLNAGGADSWVNSFSKDPSTADFMSWLGPIIEDSNPSEAGSSGNSNDYEFTPGEPVDITTEHESWVGPVIENLMGIQQLWDQGTTGLSNLGSFRALFNGLGGSSGPSSSGSKRKQGPGARESFVGGTPSPGTQGSNSIFGDAPDFEDFEKDPITGLSNISSPGGPVVVGGAEDSFTGAVNRSGGNLKSEFKGDVDWHVGAWNFKVEINGVPTSNSSFLTISGITTETEAIEFKFSTDQYLRSIPGRTKFSDVELTRVYKMGSDEFYKWRRRIERGIDDFRNVTIHLHNIDLDQAPVLSLTLHDCYPMKWECPEMNAGGSDGAIEKITLDVSQVTSAVGGTRKPTDYD